MPEDRRDITPELRRRFPRRPCVLDVIAAHPTLDTASVVVLLVLNEHAFGTRDRCWPSVPRIAALVRKHERTVQRALGALEAAGLIATEEADTRTGREFVLLWKVTDGAADGTTGDAHKPEMSPPGVPHVATPVTPGSPESSRELPKKQQHEGPDVVAERAIGGEVEEPGPYNSPWPLDDNDEPQPVMGPDGPVWEHRRTIGDVDYVWRTNYPTDEADAIEHWRMIIPWYDRHKAIEAIDRTVRDRLGSGEWSRDDALDYIADLAANDTTKAKLRGVVNGLSRRGKAPKCRYINNEGERNIFDSPEENPF